MVRAALPRHPFLSPALGLSVLFLAPPGLAAGLDPVTYELIGLSEIHDDCQLCDRVPLDGQLSGTFVLIPDDPRLGESSFAIRDLEFRSAGGDYVVRGEGRYSVAFDPPGFDQALALVLEVNGVKGIVLASEYAPAETGWPFIDIRVEEPEVRDPMHIYAIRILAAPQPALWVPYALGKGSTLTDGCLCPRPPIEVPIEGTFLLGRIEQRLDLWTTGYIAKDIEFRSPAEFASYRVSGGGLYFLGGDFAPMDGIRLLLKVNDQHSQRLEGGSTPPNADFPAIDIEVGEELSIADIDIYSFRIVAEPAGSPLPIFLRGDSNGDAQRDLADAIAILSHLFIQGPGPCRDAMDTNDDGVLDLGDPIGLLNYLFASGSAPAEPSRACGVDPTRDDRLDCAVAPECP